MMCEIITPKLQRSCLTYHISALSLQQRPVGDLNHSVANERLRRYRNPLAPEDLHPQDISLGVLVQEYQASRAYL